MPMPMPVSKPRPEMVALILACGIFLLLLLGKMIFEHKPRYDQSVVEVAEGNVRKALQLSVIAHQDSSPAIALIHISQALALVETVQMMLGDEEASRISRVHVPGLVATLGQQQNDILSSCAQRCPDIVPYGGQVAWDQPAAE